MTKFIGIMCPKGGVGKTTTALNLAASMAHFNPRTVLVEGNISTPHIGIHLGLVKDINTIHNVLTGNKTILDVIYQHNSGLKLILGDISLKNLEQKEIVNMIRKLNGLCDYVVLDSPAGLGSEALNLIDAIDKAIIVVNPDILSCTEGLRLIKLLETKGKHVLGIVLNKVNNDKHEISKEDAEVMLGKNILLEIPEDKIFRKALNEGKILIHSYPNHKISEKYKELGAFLVGKEYKSKWKSLADFFKPKDLNK